MKLFVNIVIDGKLLTIFGESSILDLLDWGSQHTSGISKAECNLKVKFTFYHGDTFLRKSVTKGKNLRKNEEKQILQERRVAL